MNEKLTKSAKNTGVMVAEERLRFALQYYRHLSHVDSFVRSHLHESFSLNDVAKSVGLSSSRLSHLFREKTGINFRDWVIQRRVNLAIKLLQDQDMAIADVARAVGFLNVRSLERAFKKILRMTPMQFKKSVFDKHCPRH